MSAKGFGFALAAVTATSLVPVELMRTSSSFVVDRAGFGLGVDGAPAGVAAADVVVAAADLAGSVEVGDVADCLVFTVGASGSEDVAELEEAAASAATAVSAGETD